MRMDLSAIESRIFLPWAEVRILFNGASRGADAIGVKSEDLLNFRVLSAPMESNPAGENSSLTTSPA